MNDDQEPVAEAPTKVSEAPATLLWPFGGYVSFADKRKGRHRDRPFSSSLQIPTAYEQWTVKI